jgi:hypothetical protein
MEQGKLFVSKYIMNLAGLCQSLNAPLVVIGVEFRIGRLVTVLCPWSGARVELRFLEPFRGTVALSQTCKVFLELCKAKQR